MKYKFKSLTVHTKPWGVDPQTYARGRCGGWKHRRHQTFGPHGKGGAL